MEMTYFIQRFGIKIRNTCRTAVKDQSQILFSFWKYGKLSAGTVTTTKKRDIVNEKNHLQWNDISVCVCIYGLIYNEELEHDI